MREEPERMATPDWLALLDELKDKESLPSDAKLAKSLGVTRGYICSVRKGRKNISLALAKKIFSRLGRTFEAKSLERLFVPVKVRQYASALCRMRRDVISRAHGRCQLCGKNAPFEDPEGVPYLEVHHIAPVADEDSDVPSNAVALCPNCHRKIELCPSPEDLKKLARLVGENTARQEHHSNH